MKDRPANEGTQRRGPSPFTAILVAVPVVLPVACGNGDEQRTSSGEDERVVFVADGGDHPRSVSILSSEAPDGQELRIVARGLDAIYGIGFRLRYSGTSVRVAALNPAESWPERCVALAKEPEPGLLFAVVTGRGAFEGLEGQDRELARIRLAESPSPSPVTFDVRRSQVLGTDGDTQLDVAWVGGAFVAVSGKERGGP